MNQLSVSQKAEGCLPFLNKASLASAGPAEDFVRKVETVVTAVGDRLKVFSDILDYKEFFVTNEALVYDAKAFQQRLVDAPEAVGLLTALREKLATVEPFDAATLDVAVHAFVEANGIKIGQIVHALRIATTGRSVGVGLFDAMAILGRETCLARIDQSLKRVHGEG